MAGPCGVHEKGTYTLQDLMNSVKAHPDYQKAGAIALFIGVARGENKQKETVTKLELEAYTEKANKTLQTICKQLSTKQGIIDVQIHHLVGTFDVGEELVYVAVTGSHRTNVFPVLQEAVERYKHEAPIFKKEHVTTRKGTPRAYWVKNHENTNKDTRVMF